MPIDMSFVHTSEFKESEAGQKYWKERMELEAAEKERVATLERRVRELESEVATYRNKYEGYYILIEDWAVYVKEGSFFESQGGLTQPWGKNWIKIHATSIEEARDIGEKMREARR